MSKWARWETHEYDLLKVLISEGLTNQEISEIIGRPRNAIQMKSYLVAGGNPNFRTRQIKHKHLREEALLYFRDHTAEETQKHFGLTKSEFHSCLTAAYMVPELAHLRKETRTHDQWTVEELLFLLRHAGLQQRSWIAKKIKRGNPRAIKEKLMSMGINTKTLNGMTLSRYRLVFGCEPRRTIDGKAGPTRGCMPTSFKMIPWVDIEADLACGRIRAPGAFVSIIQMMSRFQRWIHKGNVIRSLRLAAGRGHEPPEIKRSIPGKIKSSRRDRASVPLSASRCL